MIRIYWSLDQNIFFHKTTSSNPCSATVRIFYFFIFAQPDFNGKQAAGLYPESDS